MTDLSPQSKADPRTVLRLAGVRKSYGNVVAVESVDISVKQNQLVTLLGPSGCGKTTTLRMIAGFEYPTSGQIIIDDKDITFTPPNKREIGIVFQSYSLFPHLRVSENVAYGLKRRGVSKDEQVVRVREALDLVDLGQFGNRLPYELSGGQQQRVALARAIVIRPKILLLDEPLSALDAKLRQRMRFEIRHLQQKIGMTTVLVTHDQEEALSMSDHIVVMNKGAIEQQDTPSKIYRHPRTPFVASFIGETNLFDGITSEPSGDNTTILFKADCGFEASIPNSGNLPPGKRLLLSLRPETLMVTPHDETAQAARNSIRGTVMGVNYLGSRTVLEIKTPTRELLVSLQNDTGGLDESQSMFSDGQPVTLSWKPEACQIIETMS